MNWRSLLPLTLAALVVFPAVFSAQQQADRLEETARNQFRSGLTFLTAGNASEGLKDLQGVVDLYPSSSVADDALLEIAKYHLDRTGDLAAARKAVDLLISKYPTATDTLPMAKVLSGRIGLAQAEAVDDIGPALADFDRVSQHHPRSPAVAAALTYAGEAQRVARRLPEAVQSFEQVTSRYPRSPWAARALLGLARAQVALGSPQQALQALARVRGEFPDTPEADQARDWATILFRFHVRAPAAPAYAAADRQIAGSAGRLEGVVAIAVEPDERVAVLSRDGLLRFARDNRVVDTVRAVDARAMALGHDGQTLIAMKGSLQRPSQPNLPLSVLKTDGTPRLLDDVQAVGYSRIGQVLVADAGLRNITRFGADGKAAGVFAALDVERLAVNDIGLVAVIERAGRGVAVLDQTGKPAGRIAATGRGYDLREPVDVAWDGLGHLYVLERDLGAVVVFSPALQLVTSFTVPQKSPASFRRATAFAVDGAGRVFIHEDRTKVIRVYQ